MAMEDNDIIQMFFDRDENAIKEMSIKYGNYCSSIAKNILKNNEDAEECVNDTYLKVWNVIPPNIPVMEEIIRKRFNGKYPVRKTIQTEFAHRGGENGLLFQVDGIAYKERG